MTGLKTELSRLQNLSTSIAARYAKLDELREAARAAIAPVRHLPLELLLEIAKYAMDSVDSTRSDSLQVRAEVWAMSQVCRKWRVSILTCSSLWNRIRLRYVPGRGRGSYAFRNPNSGNILDTILSRSGDMELELEFFFSRPTEWDGDFDDARVPSSGSSGEESSLLTPGGSDIWDEIEEESDAVMTDQTTSDSENEQGENHTIADDHSQDIGSFFSNDRDQDSQEARKIATAARLLLRKLLLHSSRWRTVHLSIPCAFLSLLEPVRNKCERLRHLSVRLLDKYFQALSIVIPSLTAFREAPCLEELSLHDIPPQCTFDFPWSQILLYKDTGSSSVLSSQVFKFMPNVVECTMGYYSNLGADDETLVHSSTEIYRNLNVRKLSLGKERLLSRLALPNLKDLTYHEVEDMGMTSEVDGGVLPCRELFFFLERSACNLTHLTLGGRNCDVNPVISLLEYTPSVVSLSFLSLKSLTSSLSRLSRDRRHFGDYEHIYDPLLPHLQALKFTFHNNEEIHSSLLRLRLILNAAVSRRTASSEVGEGVARHLEYLSIYSDRALGSYYEPELVDSFLELQKDGMRLSFIFDEEVFAQDECPELSLL